MTKMSNSCCFSTLLFAFAIIVVGNAIKIECQIIGGYSSNKSQFPFYVYLRTVLNGTINGNCGGVLLSSEWILTAAHCLDDTDKVQAHFGSWQREQYDEVGRLIYGIRQKYFHVHPQYDANGWKNDIALIRMRNPLLLQPGSIEAVIFPNTCSVDADEELIAIGNGYIKNGTTEMASVLQYGTLTTTTREECKKKFKWIDEEKVFCAKGYDGKERICYGMCPMFTK